MDGGRPYKKGDMYTKMAEGDVKGRENERKKRKGRVSKNNSGK